MKNKRKFLIMIFSSLILFSFSNVNATSIDTSMVGDVGIKISFGDLNLNDVDVSIYQVGNIDASDKITYLDEFIDNEEYTDLTASQIDALAKKMYKTIQKKNVKPINKLTTNQTGMVAFEGLKVGMYLIKAGNAIRDNYEYVTSPQILMVPTFDQINKRYLYSYSAVLKVESKKINSDDGIGGNNNVGIPNTFDAIMLYVSIFAVALLGIVIIVYYIKKSKKGGKENENEKNN